MEFIMCLVHKCLIYNAIHNVFANISRAVVRQFIYEGLQNDFGVIIRVLGRIAVQLSLSIEAQGRQRGIDVVRRGVGKSLTVIHCNLTCKMSF
jgi:hypothetical protein